MTTPNHIAIIMDGNRRWAKLKEKNPIDGHKAGAETLVRICNEIKKFNIKYLTVYAFSSENNHRPYAEKLQLFSILDEYLTNDIKKLEKSGISVKFIGDFSIFTQNIQKKIEKINAKVIDNICYNLTICLNYGGKEEIVHACKMAKSIENITAETISNNLYINFPDVDLLIRTGGMQRLSNFLIWQSTYAELYFCKTLWPDFTIEDFSKSLEFFQSQQRNFGK